MEHSIHPFFQSSIAVSKSQKPVFPLFANGISTIHSMFFPDTPTLRYSDTISSRPAPSSIVSLFLLIFSPSSSSIVHGQSLQPIPLLHQLISQIFAHLHCIIQIDDLFRHQTGKKITINSSGDIMAGRN